MHFSFRRLHIFRSYFSHQLTSLFLKGYVTMSEDIRDRIAAFFAELELRPDKPRGARAMLMPYAGQMRRALGLKLNRQELLESLRSRGLSVSRSMLREILNTVPDEPETQKVTRQNKSTRRSGQSPATTANGPAAATSNAGTPLTAKETDRAGDHPNRQAEPDDPLEFL